MKLDNRTVATYIKNRLARASELSPDSPYEYKAGIVLTALLETGVGVTKANITEILEALKELNIKHAHKGV